MKLLSLILICCFSISLVAQTPYRSKKKRSDYFGKAKSDVRQLGKVGLQISVGPTFTLASLNKEDGELKYTNDQGLPVESSISQSGKIGANIEIGLAHYNMKSPKFRFGRIVDYFDYGVGFKYFRGTEETRTDFFDITNRIDATITGDGKMANGYLGVRFSLHKMTYIKNSKLYIDNALGFNGDYLLLSDNKDYSNRNSAKERFSKSLIVNFHYSFGLGIRLKRGSYLIPGAYIPILALEEFGKESIHWFSSRYYPITCQIKWIYLLSKSKKKTDCSINGTEEDKKKNREYMQNK
jgi:hypothetical protein